VLEVAGKRERLQARIDTYQNKLLNFGSQTPRSLDCKVPRYQRSIRDESDASDDADEDYQDVFAASPFDDHLPAESNHCCCHQTLVWHCVTSMVTPPL